MALYPEKDEDWFKLYLEVPPTDPPQDEQILTIQLLVPLTANFNLALFDAAGQLLATSTQPGEALEYINRAPRLVLPPHLPP